MRADWDWSRVAVMAREWRWLEPVRAYCEHHGITVQMADEAGVPLWRLRETQHLVRRLREAGREPLALAQLAGWVADRAREAALPAASRWWSVLAEAVAEYRIESVEATLPGSDFVEWLAEWGREWRQRPQGLTLLTAHRAKGLEFDHVLVLDGRWGAAGRREDADAPRRLYYVAMTRARQTLTLMHMEGEGDFLPALRDAPCALWRAPVVRPPVLPGYRRQYVTVDPSGVDLSFAGRYGERNPVHTAIASLRAGDALSLVLCEQRWMLCDSNGQAVGRMANKFQPPDGTRCVRAAVAAIMTRRKADSAIEYQDRCRCDEWEVVLPELVFEPTD